MIGSAPSTRLFLTSVAGSWAWMKRDALIRLLPFAAAFAAIQLAFRPSWSGWSLGDLPAQLGFAGVAAPILFLAAMAVQLVLARRRRALSVPANASDAWFQAGYYVINGPLEEAFFRGLIQGGLGSLTLPLAGFIVATTVYVLYHRLGWSWPDTLATMLLGIPLGLAFWLLPGPPSLLGVSIAHVAATCGFLGPGPYLLNRFAWVGPRLAAVLDARQRDTVVFAGLAVVLSSFGGSVLVLSLPAVASDFHASLPALSNLGSLLSLGALGAFPLATLADHLGRRRMIAVGVAGFSVANLASAFAPSIGALTVCRVVAVCFEGLVGSAATALIIEEAPPERRGQAMSLLATLGGTGLLIAIIAYPIVAPHWRWMFLAASAGLVAAPLIWRRLPEGRAWARAHVTTSAVRLLLQHPWRFRVVVLMVVTVLTSLVLEPAGLLYTVFASATLHMSPGVISLVIFFSGVVAVVAYLAGGYLSDRFGRRGPGVGLTFAYIAFAAIGFVTGPFGFVAGNLLWSGFASAATPVMGAWGGELYPTRARATAEATGGLAGALGGIAGLQAVALLSRSLGLGQAIAVVGVVALAGAAVLLLLPETKGRPLPD